MIYSEDIGSVRGDDNIAMVRGVLSEGRSTRSPGLSMLQPTASLVVGVSPISLSPFCKEAIGHKDDCNYDCDFNDAL